VPRLVVRPLQQFFRLEAAAGLVLLGATIAALIWANVAGAAYEDFWTTQITVTVGDFEIEETVRDLVNDGLTMRFPDGHGGSGCARQDSNLRPAA
jgi:NhaA family Na+:H+ antiporter